MIYILKAIINFKIEQSVVKIRSQATCLKMVKNRIN